MEPRNISVLVVEDDTKIRDIVRERVVEGMGWDGFYTDSVEGAREILRCNFIDVVVLDIRLRGSDGFELVEWMSREGEYSGVRVLFLTRFTEVETRVKCFECGGSDYLPKPFFPEELRVRLARLVKKDLNRKVIIYKRGISLTIADKKLEFDRSTIFLSSEETRILECLFTRKHPCTYNVLLKFLNRKVTYHNALSLRTNISRLNSKFYLHRGHKLVKNRRGVGYSIYT